jgi:AraC-like DNA-binding protein
VNHATFAANVPSVFRFSTDEWPERDRLEALREVYGRTIVRFDVEPAPDAPLHLEARFHALPGLGLAFAHGSASRIRRTPKHVVNDDLILRMGGGTFFQRGRETILGEGDAILATGAEVSASVMSKSQLINFRVPYKAMKPLVADLEDRIARPIQRDTPALSLLRGYVGLLQDEQALATPELCRSAVTHVYDLLALALGATRDAAETAKMRGVRAARLHAVITGIDQHLAKPELSAAWLGAKLGLSDRYVQLLLAGTGTSFSDLVRCKRIERARRILEQPSATPRRIVDVAFSVGFGDLSNFNRAFRAHFGCTPSDVLKRH